MSTQKQFVRPDPLSKEKLRAMLTQAVRNTQPELNKPPAPAPVAKQRIRPAKTAPAKRAAKGRKGRG
jgi:hypothetical protein